MLLRLLKQMQWKYGMRYFTISRNLYQRLGILPITRFYYEPFPIADKSEKQRDLSIDFRIEHQKQLLSQFLYQKELTHLPVIGQSGQRYYYQNNSYEFGDAEVLFSMIRHLKPNRIIEIGSGFSTLMALEAIQKNRQEDHNYACNFTCIEPYEFAWLATKPMELIRKRVEEIDIEVFKELKENDILFIDSSHVVRPHGDVLFEFLHILPSLSKGVIIHVHDIFTPNDYPADWVNKEFRLWHEQYLLEALLTGNPDFQVLLSLNYLHQMKTSELYEACPMLKQYPKSQPGAFWIKKVK